MEGYFGGIIERVAPQLGNKIIKKHGEENLIIIRVFLWGQLNRHVGGFICSNIWGSRNGHLSGNHSFCMAD